MKVCSWQTIMSLYVFYLKPPRVCAFGYHQFLLTAMLVYSPTAPGVKGPSREWSSKYVKSISGKMKIAQMASSIVLVLVILVVIVVVVKSGKMKTKIILPNSRHTSYMDVVIIM